MANPPQFPEWLSQLSSTGQRIDLPQLRLGVVYIVTLDIAEHELLEDWTGGAFEMQAKASPGAVTALATFEVTAGEPDGGVTPIVIEVAIDEQGDIPEPGDDGVSELYYDILFTPSGSSPVLVAGGLLPVIAGVTE